MTGQDTIAQARQLVDALASLWLPDKHSTVELTASRGGGGTINIHGIGRQGMDTLSVTSLSWPDEAYEIHRDEYSNPTWISLNLADDVEATYFR